MHKRQKLPAMFLAFSLTGSCGASSEVQSVVDQQMEKKVSHCGDSYYTRASLPEGEWWFEFRDLSWKVESVELTEADRLNGMEFKGKVSPQYSAIRMSARNGSKECWYPWEEWNNLYDSYNRPEIKKANGKWDLGDFSDTYAAPDCSEAGQISDCG